MNSSTNFPCFSHNLESELPVSIKPWILDPNSFIAKLRENGVQNPAVKVLEEVWQKPLEDEARILELVSDSLVLIRTVLIISENKCWMYARTVFPRETLTGDEEALAHLQNRSLGSILFQNPAWQRGKFEFAKLNAPDSWYKKINDHVTLLRNELWARRSLFSLEEKKLLLTEIYLPDIEQLELYRRALP